MVNEEHEVIGRDTATPVRRNADMRDLLQTGSCRTWQMPVLLSLLPFFYNLINHFTLPRSVVMSGCVINQVTNITKLNEATQSLKASMTIPDSAGQKTFQNRGDELPLWW
jgi:hypothetical protein